MLFTSHAVNETQREQMDRLGELLGIIWTKEAAAMLHDSTPERDLRKPRERLVIPFLAGLKPEILDVVRKSFGSPTGIDAPEWYRSDRGEVVEAFNMPRDEFLRLAGIFTPLIPKTQ